MRHAIVGALLGSLLFVPSEVLACRHPREPYDLKDDKADGIVLTTIKDVRLTTEMKWPRWVATASVNAVLCRKSGENEITFTDEGPGSCQLTGKPKLGKYYVLYLRQIDGRTFAEAMPFWWAWRSGDPRLAKLLKLMSIGNVREPTAEEASMLDLAEPRVRLPHESRSLDRYTRIYSRDSARLVRALFFRSRTRGD
jgi:hypothetical protein